MDIYKGFFYKNANERQLVKVGKYLSALLAIFAILVAPMVANAPEGLYQLLQQLNGIYFIPVASILIAGFFIKKISALGAKVSLIVGLSFYILMTFILKTDIHFVHIWGIEFLLNIATMLLISRFYPYNGSFSFNTLRIDDMKQWKYTKVMSYSLCIITVLIYIVLGNS